MKRLTKAAVATTAILAAAAFTAPHLLAQDSLYVPNLSYRTGPFAATGTPLMNGQQDYMTLLNERDGGINGVRIDYDECETGYNTERGMECYEATRANAIVTQPWSTGITLQVLPRTNVDEIPVLAPGYGFSPMADGRTFKWAFNPPSSYWDGASMLLNFVADGDLSSLDGKKIVLLHLDAPYGREPVPLFENYAEDYNFTFLPIPVGVTEMQNQSAQWLQIRRENPDYVFMWGWGAMNAGAVTEAVRTRFPMERFFGIWWSGHDGDLAQAGESAAGYRAISWNVPVPDAPVIQEIREHVIDAGLSSIGGESEIDWVFYQRGITMSMMLAEAIRTAQEEFDETVVSPEQVRWGLENLDISEERLEELGMSGMIVPFQTTCANHTGHGGGWIIEWNGERFERVSDLLQADRERITPLEEEEAAKYAEANAPWPTNDECEL
ncbi:MAG: ABC transporter substrate-binding protein [Rhizobiaceae bacterium]